MDQTGKDTVAAVKTLKALGGIDGCMLDKLDLEKKQCYCCGTPIGDRLLTVAGKLDPNGTTLLPQSDADVVTDKGKDKKEESEDADKSKDKKKKESNGDHSDVNEKNYPNLHKYVSELHAEDWKQDERDKETAGKAVPKKLEAAVVGLGTPLGNMITHKSNVY